MLANKWILFIMTALIALIPGAEHLPWVNVLTTAQANEVITALGVLLSLLTVIMPKVGQTTIVAEKSFFGLFTHT
jgi:hypothetical protein